MKTIPILVALLGAVNLYAVNTGPTIPVYGTGGFEDPTNNRLDTDLSQRWGGAPDLSGAKILADSFTLRYNSVLSKIELWSYDTADGSAGTLQEIRYGIFTGATQPTGAPIAAGLGQITSSAGLEGHHSGIDEHGGGDLWVIQTVFNLVTPVRLAPNVNYWLVLTARTDPFGVSNNSQWAEAGKDDGDAGSYLVLTPTGWETVAAGDRAFELDGQGTRLLIRSGPDIEGVPDGGWTLPLLLLALAPLLRFRSHRGAARHGTAGFGKQL